MTIFSEGGNIEQTKFPMRIFDPPILEDVKSPPVMVSEWDGIWHCVVTKAI